MNRHKKFIVLLINGVFYVYVYIALVETSWSTLQDFEDFLNILKYSQGIEDPFKIQSNLFRNNQNKFLFDYYQIVMDRKLEGRGIFRSR